MENKKLTNFILIAGMLGGVIGGVIGFSVPHIAGWDKGAAMQGAPMIILNPIDFMNDATNPTSEDMSQAFNRMNTIAIKFAKQGYIVLDQKSVLKAPMQYIYQKQDSHAE